MSERDKALVGLAKTAIICHASVLALLIVAIWAGANIPVAVLTAVLGALAVEIGVGSFALGRLSGANGEKPAA